tara:strand:+ start:1664 stop:2560 length:897 start_codon:yes stop_codon:yes gene_type:complete
VQFESKLLVESFLDNSWLEKNLSENTLASYKNDLSKFYKFTEKNNKNVIIADHLMIISYLSVLIDEGLASKTISRNISALKSFYAYLHKFGHIKINPTENIEPPKSGLFLPTTLSVEETERLLNSPSNENYIELRDKAMLFALYASGMRISELINLTLNHLDLNRGSVQVLGKGNKERLIPITDQAIKIIQIYLLQSRDRLAKNKDHIYVFLSTHGKKMTRQSFWHRLKIYMRRERIEKDIHPHTLRHAFATHMLNNGADLRSVQLLLGHSDLSTTQIYTHVAQSEIKTLHKKHHPRG